MVTQRGKFIIMTVTLQRYLPALSKGSFQGQYENGELFQQPKPVPMLSIDYTPLTMTLSTAGLKVSLK